MKELVHTFQKFRTPFYWYDMTLLDETLNLLINEAGRNQFKVHYAIKANANLRILDKISALGLGADCVSGNEILQAIKGSFKPKDIVFAGVGKSDEEINIGLDHDIFAFNVESIAEIEVINELAQKKNKTAHIALRLNPNVDALTHKYITTGVNENKFGINLNNLDDVLQTLNKCNNIELTGIHFHIGSQITDLKVFKELCIKVNEIQDWFVSMNITIKHLNMGGGLGINYDEPCKDAINDFTSYFRIFAENLKLRPDQEVHFELGRSIVAQCGSLITKVLYIKEGMETNFAIVDAGITELIRPALYQAHHKIKNISSELPEKKYDVVGPICESADFFSKGIFLPETKRGDLIAIRSTGAYGQVMTSQYNLRRIVDAHYSDDLND